jgi:hypothetical protein
MKTLTNLIAITAVFTVGSLYGSSLIAYWDFDDGYAVDNDTVQITHNTALGSGTLYQQRADTDGNGKGGNAFNQSGFTGLNTSISSAGGKAMAWDDVGKSGANDAEFFLTFSTSGYRDIQLGFDLKGNDEAGILSFDLKYSFSTLLDVTNPTDITGTIKDFDLGFSTSFLNNEATLGATNTPAFERVLVDFNALSEINDRAYVAIRMDDFKENDAMSIDNILITGTAIPEPKTYGLITALLLAGFVGYRRFAK